MTRLCKRSLCVALAISLAACAASPISPAYRPIVDTAGVDMNQYERDLAECKQFAAQVDAERTTAANAVAGAVFATALGAILGLRGRDLGRLAGAAAVTSGTSGAAYAGMTQAQIVGRCLIGRGYRVLAAVGKEPTT